MPHAWWHRPEIWSDYAAPALGAAVQAPVIKQTLEGIEALHRRGTVPAVSRALETLPFRWEETAPGVPKGGEGAWWDPLVRDRLQQGRLVGNFDQYLTPEGGISPGGVLRQLGSVSPAGWAQAIAEENLPITPVRPDTLQQQNIMDEARARGIGPFRQDPFADFTPSGRQQREIREDLYKLPPYTRGIAEELPYLAIPPARAIRGGLQGVRAGAALSDAGRLGRMAPVARGTIRGTEMALKPVELLEEGLARAVAAPFRGAAAAYRAARPSPQVPQIPRGPSAQQAIMGPSLEPTPAPGTSVGHYQRQGTFRDVPPTLLEPGVPRAAPQPTPAPVVQAVPEPTVAAAVPEQVVSRETLPNKERVQLLSESTNPVVRELLKIHTEGNPPLMYGSTGGRPVEASNIGLDLSRRESKQLDEALVSLQGTRSQTTGELTDSVISRVPMRIRDRTVRGGFRSESGIQVARNREGRTPEQINRFLAALEEIDVTPSRADGLPQELPVNRVNRPDLPEQYFDDAGELLTEEVVITNYINPIREIVDVDKPRGGWSSVIRKLERQMAGTEDADIVEGLDDVAEKIDEFRDMEREGMSALEFGEAKDDVFGEIKSSLEDLRPSDQFADTLEEAVEINRLIAETPEPSVAAAVPEPAVQAVPEPSVAAVDNQPVIRGKTTGYQPQLEQDIISIPDSAYPANRGFGVQRIAEVFRNARNMTRNQNGELIDTSPFEMQGAYGQRTSFEMMAEVRDAVIKVYEEDARFLNNNNFNRVIRNLNRQIDTGDFEGTFDDMLEDFLVELSTVSGTGRFNEGLRSGASRQQFLDELRKPVEPSVAAAVPEPSVAAAAPTAPAVPEPLDVQVGISAAVLPEQRGRGYTEFFTDDDYYNWQQAKDVLERPPTALSLETALRVPEIQAAQNMIDQLSIAGRDRVQKTLSDAGFEGTVDTNSGLFGGAVEPSLVIRATVPADQLDDFTRTVVDIADTDFNQKNVIVHTPQPSTGNTLGRTVNAKTLGETLEPAFTIRFTRELSQAEIQRYGARYVELEKEMGLSGFGGFATHADRQGLDILNLTVYNDNYNGYIETVNRFIRELQNDGLGIEQTFKQSTRRVRTIGDTGDGIATYADYRSYHDTQKLPTGTAAERITGPEPTATPELTGTRFERPTAEEPYFWDFELPAGRAEQIAGQADLAITSPQNSTPMAYAKKVAELGDAGHSMLMDNMSNAVARVSTKFGRNATDKVVDAAKQRDSRVADEYVRLTKKWWDGNYVMNLLEDTADFRSSHPNSPSNFGGSSHKTSIVKTPISDRIIKSTGTAVNKGSARYIAFMRDDIFPLLERGATPEAIERYVQAKHYQILAGMRNFSERYKDGVLIYARDVTTAQASKSEKYTIVDDMVFEKFGWDDLQGWTDRKSLSTQGFSDDAIDAIEEGANKLRRVYVEERERLFKNGIISRATRDDWNKNFKWYHPIDYAEYVEEAADGLSGGIGSGFNVSSDGIYQLSAKPHLMGAMPPLGQSMAKHLIQNELRITRNKVTSDVVDLGIAGELGLKDVSSKFVQRTKNEAGETVEKLLPVRYNETLKSGYLTFYRDGKRFAYGSRDGTEAPEWLWDALNGRNGMGITGGREIQAQLAAANGWFRSINTTYNPNFFVRNALIDMLTVSNKAGINPAVSTGRIIKSLYNAASGTEDRLMELMQYGGGWSDRYYDASGNISKVIKAIQDSGQDARVALDDKELRKLLEESVNPNTSMGKKVLRTIPATGAAIEQAPRLAVARQALHRYIGKKEYNRIMKLDRKDFEEEMLNNWRPKFDVNDNPIDTPQGLHRGLVDSDELQLAAQNSIDATLNFGRGGDQIKRWNNYVLFLNAAMEGFKQPFRTLGINLHPVIRPVRNPVRGEAQFEFGSISEQTKNYLQSIGFITPGGRGITGRSFDIVGGQKMFFGRYGPELIGPRAAAWRMGQILTAYWGIQTYWNKQFKYEGTPLYYDIPTHIRYNSLIFMLDSERNEAGEYVLDPQTGRPTPRYIAIPHRLREWNMFFQSATLLDEATDEDVAMDKSRFAGELWKSTSPVSDLPIPEIFNVGIEEWKGYDMYRQTDIIPEELQGEVPSEQFGPWTSESVRRASGVIDEVPMPDTFSQFLTSPQRVDHLYENIFGGVGKMAMNISDFGLSLMDDLRGLETRPMEERVEEYREMDRTARTEFTTSLSPEEYEEFQREIRMPKKQLPFWDSLSYSFFPQRGGGLKEMGQAQLEQVFPNISREDTISAGRAMSKVRRGLLTEQQQNDSYLTNWRNKAAAGGKLAPKEWRDAKSDKWQKYEGATLAVSEIYKRAIQGADDETKDAYYDTLYTAAGMMPDIRQGVDFLLAGYYAIEPTETDPTNVNWDEFFEARAEYVENIRTSSEAAGDDLHAQFTRALQANDTPTEIAYDEARRMLSPYWNAGKNPDELYPNMQPPLSQAMPQVTQQWMQYLAADRGTQRQMYDSIPLIQTLVKRRSQLRDSILIQDGMNGGGLDEALVFWYGDFHEGVTSRGKAFHNKLYGSTATGFTPRPSPAIPVRTR